MFQHFLNWIHTHTHGPTPPAPTPDVIGPGPNLPIPHPNNHPYFNGMKDPVPGGFVTLEAAETQRHRALTSGNQKLAQWARTTLPFKYAVAAAVDQPELGLSDADKFSVQENAYFAHVFYEPLDPSGSLERKTWCPQAFIASKPTSPGKLYDQGPTIPGYASFAASVGPADLDAIFSAAFDAASKL